VDDASTDGMTAPAAERHGVRLIGLDQRHGPAHARNHGAKEASGDIFFFTDADVMLHTDAVAIAVDVLASAPDIGAVFGSYDDQPGHASFLSQYRNLFHHWVHQTGNDEASTFWAGCGAVRREVFIEMSGFDRDYRWPSIEDVELGTRLRNSGHRIRLEKTMLGKHMKRWKFWNLIRTDIFNRGVPWMGLVLRDRRIPNDLNLNYKSRIATILAALLGLSLFILPLSGRAAAVLPAAAFLLATALGARFSSPTGKFRGSSLLLAALTVAAPPAAYILAPDALAVIPLVLILALIWTHLAFYRYVAAKRSVAFAIAVVPMQVLFFLGCAISVPLGLIRHIICARKAGREPTAH
jgi:hypothetical protein